MLVEFLSNKSPKAMSDLKKDTAKLNCPASLEDYETAEGRAYVKAKPEAE